jgi:hypothetical protein
VALGHFVLALANEATQVDGPPTPFSDEERAALRAAQAAHSQAVVQHHRKPAQSVQAGNLVFITNDEAPAGKIAKTVRARRGPFRVVSVSQGSPTAPLKARVALLGDASQELDVFVRDVTPCGPQLTIDDPMLRTLPPSGYFVAELVDDDDPLVLDRLRAIVEQALDPQSRARLQAERYRRAAAIREEEEEIEKIEKELSRDSDSMSLDSEAPEEEADDLEDDDDDDNLDVDDDDDDGAGNGNNGPPPSPPLLPSPLPRPIPAPRLPRRGSRERRPKALWPEE